MRLTAESYFGSCHLMELPFFFDELCLPTLHGPDALLGTEPPPDSLAARVHGLGPAVGQRCETGNYPTLA